MNLGKDWCKMSIIVADVFLLSSAYFTNGPIRVNIKTLSVPFSCMLLSDVVS